MTLSIELYEDSGPKIMGHGTTQISVDNIGWKSSGLDETNSYIYNPLNRSISGVVGWGYTKYNYIKISGTYAGAARPRIQISGAVNGAPPTGYIGTDKVRLYYKLSNVYAPPTNNFDGSLIYLPPGVTQLMYPTMSNVGPESATDYLQHMSENGTYYSQYLVTQLFVEPGSQNDYGNIGEVVIKVFIDEYDTTDY